MVKSYIVAYDPNRTAAYYEGLLRTIEELGEHWHCLNAVFIIRTDKNAEQIRRLLSPTIDLSEKLLVAEIAGPVSHSGFSGDCRRFLDRTGS